MKVELRSLLEAILLSAKAPMTVEDIKDVFKRAWEAIKEEEDAPDHDEVYRVSRLKKSEIIRELETLEAEWDERGGPYRIRCVAEAWRLISEPEYSTWLRTLYGKRVRPPRLTQPALETLAIVAYRQPLTRAQIEEIRGVAVDGVVTTLIERELIEAAGKADAPGRPTLYQTTEGFLEYFGLRDLGDLPDAGELCRIAPEIDTSGEGEPDAESSETTEEVSADSEEAGASTSPDAAPASEETVKASEIRETDGAGENTERGDNPTADETEESTLSLSDDPESAEDSESSESGEVAGDGSHREMDDSRAEPLSATPEARPDVALNSTKDPERASEPTESGARSIDDAEAGTDSRAMVSRSRSLGRSVTRSARPSGNARLFTRREARAASRLLGRRWEDLEVGAAASRDVIEDGSGLAIEWAHSDHHDAIPSSSRALVAPSREEESKSNNRRGWRTSNWFQWIKKISIIIVSKLIGWIGKLFKCSMIVSLTLSLSARSR